MNKEIIFLILDCLIYGAVLLAFYFIINKNFIRSKIGKFLIPIFVLKVIFRFLTYYEIINLEMTTSIIDLSLLAILVVLIFLNEEKIKEILKRKRVNIKGKRNEESENNTFIVIDEVVENLSKNKTGALICFEKKNSLDDYLSNGSKLDAKISAELIETIFYPGSRLHDGAVIIRDNTIIAASVFFTPSTKPLRGNYGARHRAALGISEVSDSLTVIVSEETGRIAIAIDGELIVVGRNSFLEKFKELMEKEV